MGNVASAMEVQTLYQGQGQVQSQSEAERTKLLDSLFQDLLLRLTARRVELSHPEIQAALLHVDKYVLQYRYETDTETDVPTAAHQTLVVEFDATAVNRLLRNAKQGVWGANRPSVLLWGAVGPADNALIIGSEDLATLETAVKEYTERLGLPVLIPLLDNQDTSKLTTTDIVTFDQAKLRRAGNRYMPDALVVTHVVQQPGGQWEGGAQILEMGARAEDETQESGAPAIPIAKVSGATPEATLEALFNRVK